MSLVVDLLYLKGINEFLSNLLIDLLLYYVLSLKMDLHIIYLYKDLRKAKYYFLDLYIIVKEELEREGYPSWLAKGAIWAAEIFGGERLLDLSPKLAFTNHANRPIFAMHGTADTRVLPYHTADMKILGEQNGANLITWFAENAEHSDIKYMYSEEFSKRVVKFFSDSLEGELEPIQK